METIAEQPKINVNRKYKWGWGHLNTNWENKIKIFKVNWGVTSTTKEKKNNFQEVKYTKEGLRNGLMEGTHTHIHKLKFNSSAYISWSS